MRYLNEKNFEDLIDRFKWYLKPFTLNIFCKDKESMEMFEKEIDSNELRFNKERFEAYIRYKGIYQRIDIYLLKGDVRSFRGRRANAIIFDNNFSYNIIEEMFLPTLSIEPYCGAFPFQKTTLQKVLKRNYNLENHKINLEDK